MTRTEIMQAVHAWRGLAGCRPTLVTVPTPNNGGEYLAVHTTALPRARTYFTEPENLRIATANDLDGGRMTAGLVGDLVWLLGQQGQLGLLARVDYIDIARKQTPRIELLSGPMRGSYMRVSWTYLRKPTATELLTIDDG